MVRSLSSPCPESLPPAAASHSARQSSRGLPPTPVGAKNGIITFPEFVKTMSVLSGKATLGEKLKFCFKLFDVNDNGKIQPSEMFTLFSDTAGSEHLLLRRRATPPPEALPMRSPHHWMTGMITGRMHDDVDLQQIVDSYLKRFPNGLNFDAFSQMFTISDLAKLTLNV